MGRSSLNGLRGLGLEALGLHAHAITGLLDEPSRDLVCRGLGVHAQRVRSDDHGEVHTRDGSPRGMPVEQTVDLVERRAAPQVDEEEHLLLIGKRCHLLLDLRPKVIRTHARLQADGNHVRLVAEDHGRRLLDALREVAMTCEDNSYHTYLLTIERLPTCVH